MYYSEPWRVVRLFVDDCCFLPCLLRTEYVVSAGTNFRGSVGLAGSILPARFFHLVPQPAGPPHRAETPEHTLRIPG